MEQYQDIYIFSHGYIYVYASQNYIKKIDIKLSPIDSFSPNKNVLISKLFFLFDNYFKGKPINFNIPFSLEGLPKFTKNILLTLYKNVPYGQTITYKELAKLSGNEKAARAIGNAMAKNPIPIIIPCHRVIKSDRTLGGYSGGGLIVKEFLLKIEKAIT